ncbi:MAG: hypothetical protein FWD73_15125 [Polyangiaceae bacterium]|nr:hypothetical protein [Polyangiaceae bacterium]
MNGFDASLYDAIPQTTAAGVVALVRSMIVAGKDTQYEPAIKALKRLRTKGETLRELHAKVMPIQEKVNTRVVDNAMDRAWHALEQRLSLYADLSPEFASDAAEAAEVHHMLFPHGIAFLTLPYAQQWAEGEAIVHRMHGIEEKIDRFAGAPFLAQVHACHVNYGVALGITKPKPEKVAIESIVEPLRETRAALNTYARLLVAAVENEDLEAKVVQMALLPLAELRIKVRSMKKKRETKAADKSALIEEPASPEPLPKVG